MSFRHAIETTISTHLSDLDQSLIELSIPRYEHGDFALNIAFKLSKIKKKNPVLIANEVVQQLTQTSDVLHISQLSGFINIKVDDNYLIKYMSEFMLSSPKWDKDPSILLEYVSANPTGPLHIGHGRWAVIGDVLYRLLQAVGGNVKNEFYVNDAGNQVKTFEASIHAKKNGQSIPENGYGGPFIDTVVAEKPDDVTSIDYVIECHRQSLETLDCKFDRWFKESTLHHSNIIQIIHDEYPDLIYKKDGAVWFKTTDYNDDKDRVLQKDNGDLTYFACDIVYHLNKINRKYDHIINIWGADHHGYIERIRAAILAKKESVTFSVILGQLVNLFKDGEPIKMSKRTGNLIELDDVIHEIGVDATRYFLVEKRPDLPLDFDMTKATMTSMDNPVYYIQYAHARICSLQKKCEGLPEGAHTAINDADRKLMVHVCRYYDVLLDASNSLEPYKLPQYLHELASLFHSFYQKCPVIVDDAITPHRIAILSAVQKVIQHCSGILGISTPEKM